MEDGSFIVQNGKFVNCARAGCNGTLRALHSDPEHGLIERKCSECGARYMLQRTVVEEFIHMTEPEEVQAVA